MFPLRPKLPPTRVPRAYRPAVDPMEPRSMPSNIPVLLVPGEAGSFPVGVNSPNPAVVASAFQDFATHLGLPPTELTAQIDSLGEESAYTNLIDSLETDGYRLGVDLFVVAQDWRLPIAPLDGHLDGELSNLTPGLITGGAPYRYSTQYLGYWLMQAQQEWESTHGGQPVPYVDVIAHSEGNLITRAYISSPAYGGAYVNGQGRVDHLPRIGDYIALAAPNRGVATMFNDLHNNFYQPGALGFTQIRFEIFQLAYYEVASLGVKIDGPNGAPIIDRKTILNPRTHQPAAGRFLRQYFRVGHDLTATYRFLDGHTINRNPTFRNDMLLDLNSSRIPNAFTRTIGHMTGIFGDNQPTVTRLSREVGDRGITQPLTPNLSGFAAKPRGTTRGQVWYRSHLQAIGGDGQVPIQSLVSTFAGDPRVTLDPLAGINHITVLTDPAVQSMIDTLLQDSVPPPR